MEGKEGKYEGKRKDKKDIELRRVRAGELSFPVLKRSVTRWLNKHFRKADAE